MGLKLLCIVAHPDDECFAFGGALALAHDQGIETTVICLTDGRAATNRGTSQSSEDLGRIRRAEFMASCKILGVDHPEFMDYQDGQLEHADFSATTTRLVQRIRAIKPNVVVTFGPDGTLNTHADHTMVSCFTSAAVHWAASPRRNPEAGPVHHTDRFFYLTTTFFLDGRPAPMPSPWTVALDIRTVLERKRAAFVAHTSQAPLIERTRAVFDEHGHTEHYTLVSQLHPGPQTRLICLCEGLEA